MNKNNLLTLMLSLLLHAGVFSLLFASNQQVDYKSQSLNHMSFSPMLLTAESKFKEFNEINHKKDTLFSEDPTLENVDIDNIEEAEIQMKKKPKQTQGNKVNKDITEDKLVRETKRINKIRESQEISAIENKRDELENSDSSATDNAKNPQFNSLSGNIDPSAIDLYRENLRKEIAKYTKYPNLIKKIEGLVEVRFLVTPTGEIKSPTLIKSSGNRKLDKAVLIAVIHSQSVGVPPEGFENTVTFYIEFLK
ncbi:TonB family protein [Xenorhabdus sp. SGI240]|uniref:TonB family protein n=1 Tax=Xenorhabdus sp. SGI240 TaxID=3158262 RepID=UPI0032B83288